ncbi:MAG: hypothetical protein KDE51_17865, partial [Anaerolineales bacterium]|nr:hypothetical protein [Anaerolineales bacterium]
NVVALFALPLAFLLALITVYQRSKTPHVSIYHGWALLKPTVLFLGLTLLLTAWFWLPIVVELPYTQSRLTEPYLADWPTPQNQILLASKLVAFPEIPADLDLLNPSRLRTMGVGQAILALIGLLIAWWHPTGSERRWQLITMGGVIACCLYAMTGASLWLWDLGLDTIQLPSRLLGPASLLAALLSGQAVNQLMIWGQTIFKAKWLPVFLWGSTAALLTAASGWPWLYHLYCPVTNQPSQFELVQITTWSRIIGAAQGELLPKWVQSYPPQDLLLNQYDPTAEYVLINRLELQSATADNAAVHLPIAPAHDRYQLNLDTPTTAVYHTFYFPGWQATLDGETLPLNIQEPHGLIKLELPAGQHQLEIFFGRTLIRPLTLWLSGLTLLATLLWGLLTQNRNRPPQTTSHAPPVRPASLRPLLLVAVTLIVVKFGLVEQFNNPIRATRLQDGQLSGVDVATQINFSNQFQHLGYEMSPPLTAGERFDFRQYWTPLANLGVPYQFDFRIADEDGRIWNGPNNRPYDYVFYPGPLNWQQGKYGLDAYVSQTLVGTPPGRYWLETTAFRRDVTFALTAENAPTAADPAWARLGQIEILSPPEQPLLTTENAAVQTIHQRPLPS